MSRLRTIIAHVMLGTLLVVSCTATVYAQGFNSLPTGGGSGFNNLDSQAIEAVTGGGGSGFNSAPGGAGNNQSKLVSCEGPRCTFDDLVETGQNVMDFLIIIATSIAVIVIAYAGFMYMTSGENSGKVKKAHELMWYAVVGFLVAISAYLIVDVLLNTLNVDSSVRPAGFTGN